MGEIGRLLGDTLKGGVVVITAAGAVACAAPAGGPHPAESGKKTTVPGYTKLYEDGILTKECGETINESEGVDVLREQQVNLAGGTEQTTSGEVPLRELSVANPPCPPNVWIELGPRIPIIGVH